LRHENRIAVPIPDMVDLMTLAGVLQQVKANVELKAMAHITGGGLVGNLPRVLPADCDAVIEKCWDVPEIFSYMQKLGPVEETEMFRVFNMGVGYVLVVAPEAADRALAVLEEQGEKAWKIGEIAAGSRKVFIS